ncbi:MAG TPA: acyltransferase, partial [Nevskiaceae bacterium]|nr:acyltransferase [Nevskiaceae bacterium]
HRTSGAARASLEDVSDDAQRTYFCLDGMRGVAALAVLTAHAAMLFQHTLRQFYLAVDFFFVLSGFVLAYAYSARLAAGMPAREFIIARLVRIYPLYLIATLIGLAHAALSPNSAEAAPLPVLLGQLALALFFVPAPALTPGHWLYPLVDPGWSLLFELLGNIVFGLLWLRLHRSRPGLALLIGCSAIALLYCGFSFGTFDLGATSGDAWAAVPRVLYSFFAGVCLYQWHRRHPAPLRIDSWLLLAALTVALALHFPSRTLDLAYQYAMIVLGFPLLVYLGASSTPSARAAPLFHLLGVTSYAVYVLHVPLFFCLRDSSAHFGWNLAAYAPWSGLAFIAALLAFCVAIDRWYDVPLRRWLNQLRRTRPLAVRAAS